MGVVLARTGLTADAVRAWERRYGVVRPERGPGGHRLYSDADVTRLRLLQEAIEGGRRISDVARLTAEELERVVAEDRVARSRTARADREGADGSGWALVERALDLTRRLDSSGLEALLRRALARLGVRGFMVDLLTPLLHEVGDGWARGTITIAQEHMASTLAQNVLAEVLRTTTRAGEGRRLLVATPAGERHGIGALLAGVTAGVAGWKVVDVGVDLPAGEIAASARATAADVVAVSVVNAPDAEVLRELQVLKRLLPDHAVLVVGGAGAEQIREDLSADGIRVVTDLDRFAADLA